MFCIVRDIRCGVGGDGKRAGFLEFKTHPRANLHKILDGAVESRHDVVLAF